MEGRRILRVELRRRDLRFPFPENFRRRIEGSVLSRLARRAKYLVAELSGGEALIMHLGMTGRFTIGHHQPGVFHHPAGASARHDHVIFELEGGVQVVFNDARRFGFMDLWPLARLNEYPAFAAMGPEPVEEAFSGDYLRSAFSGVKSSVKSALMDQTVVAGLGNIYVCEALFRAGVSPQRRACRIGAERLDRLAHEVRAVIAEAIAAGGSTISDYQNAGGAPGYFQQSLRVYDREGEPCLNCARPVRRRVQAGRSTFYCSSCQR